MTRKIRVGLFQPSLPHYRVPVFHELAGRAGVEFTLHYSTRDDIRNVEPKGFHAVHAMPTFNLRDSTLIWDQTAIRIAGSGAYDVLIFPWTSRVLSLFPAICAGRNAGAGIVLWGQGASKHESAARLRIRNWYARQADAVVTYNSSVARAMVASGFAAGDVFTAINSIDHADVFRCRDEVLGNPARLAEFRRENRLSRNTILFVSRLHHANRIDVLINATAQLRPLIPDLRVILIGAGNARDTLEAQVKTLGLESVVTFTGALYGEDALAPWFASSDIFCYPSNSGLSLLHAQGYGLPLLVGDQMSAHNPEIESFADGVNGRSFRHNDAGDLARVMQEMLADRAALLNMSEAGMRNVTERFTINRMVDGLEAAIRRADSKRRER